MPKHFRLFCVLGMLGRGNSGGYKDSSYNVTRSGKVYNYITLCDVDRAGV